MKLKQCGVCLQELPSLWKAKTKENPAMCRTCALKAKGTPIGNYTMIKVSDVVDDLVEEQKRNKAVGEVKKKKPINSKSDKQKRIDAAYSVLRKQFLNDKPYCEARLHVCTGKSTSVHHTYFGSNKRKHYLNVPTWKAICSECHTFLHDKMSKEEQLERGLKILD